MRDPLALGPSDDVLRVRGHVLLPDVAIPRSWAQLARLEEFDGEMVVTAWQGTASEDLDSLAEGPPMCCIAVFLQGKASMALDGGPPLAAGPGTAVLQTAERPVRGRFRMAGGQAVRLVDIRYTPAGLLRAGGKPLAALHGDFFQDCSVPSSGSLMAGFPAPAALLRLADDILQCAYADPIIRRLYIRAKALEALAVVLQAVDEQPGPAIGPRERRQLGQARRLIEERFGEQWSVASLARAVGLGEKKLKAGFRALVGRSVHAYLREVRLEAAASLLAAGHSVTQAALAAGFSNLSHFSKSFREAKGVPPSAWAQRAPGQRRIAAPAPR